MYSARVAVQQEESQNSLNASFANSEPSCAPTTRLSSSCAPTSIFPTGLNARGRHSRCRPPDLADTGNVLSDVVDSDDSESDCVLAPASVGGENARTGYDSSCERKHPTRAYHQRQPIRAMARAISFRAPRSSSTDEIFSQTTGAIYLLL